MKKLAYIGLVAAALALTIISCQKTEKLNPASNSPDLKTAAVIDTTPDICGSFTADLIAGQNINVGTVTVTNDAETLFVTYTTTDDWLMSEIHLYVGPKEGAPVNKKGNPQVGHFPTNQTFNPMINTITYEFPLSIFQDDCFIVAAHAVVNKVINEQVVDSQTAWGDGIRFVDKGNWATYFEYCPQICDPTPEENCYESETAWADGTRYVEQGSWATYVTYQEGTVTLFAGQNMDAGTVSFSAVDNGMVTITIVLNEGWSQQEVAESVKIQGYPDVPTGNPSPGLFTTYKGNNLVVTVPAYDYYGVHLDVRHTIPCP